ncbi:MAG: DNA-processing protein DprA [Cognatishimia sp.]
MTDSQHSSTHPQLPPTTEEEKFLWLRLLRSRRVGPTTFHRLISEHGNVIDALAALPEIALAAGVKSYQICPEQYIYDELAAATNAGATLICSRDNTYPKALYDLPDAPPLLWALGNLELLKSPKIAIVGARNASSLGTRMATSIAAELGAKAHVTVSGLARGVDAAAHNASIKSGTIAIFAGGVDVTYPSENTSLAREIAQNGLILSEQPMGVHPQARHFPSRNRIISGLSKAVVVIEAATKSGSLITAKNALDQGRDVLAVPGHPLDPRASGCNILIRDGATLVRGADDILAAIAPLAPPAAKQKEMDLSQDTTREANVTMPGQKRSLQQIAKLHRQILDRLGPSPLAEDQLIRDLPSATHEIAPALVELELEGKIQRRAGGLLTRS